ncbi:hypothetical protein PMIN04_005736 [Paraphaeosphaeria minitans]
MAPVRTIVTFGAGPGIGNHVSAEFASHGFNHVILLARNEQRLSNQDAPFVFKASPNVKLDTLPLDLSDTPSIPGVLKKIDDLTQGEDLEVVFFNAARIKPSGVLDVSIEEIEEDFKQLKKTNSSSKPSLLVTNSFLPRVPIPQLLSLSLAKAGQRNMMHAFNLAFGESGVHAGLINVGGVVAPESKNLNPKNIAKRAFAFFEAGEGLDVDINE